MIAAADAGRPGEAAQTAARAWMHTYGIHTGRYTAAGGDHPMMDTLPAAFDAFAASRPTPTAAEVSRLRADLELAQSIAGGEITEREWLSQAEIGSLTRAVAAEKAEVSRLLAQVATLTTALDATADALAASEVALAEARAELVLLDEVCAIYALDETRYLWGTGEPFGSVPTLAGLKARAAGHRYAQREMAELASRRAEAEAIIADQASSDDDKYSAQFDLECIDHAHQRLAPLPPSTIKDPSHDHRSRRRGGAADEDQRSIAPP